MKKFKGLIPLFTFIAGMVGMFLVVQISDYCKAPLSDGAVHEEYEPVITFQSDGSLYRKGESLARKKDGSVVVLDQQGNFVRVEIPSPKNLPPIGYWASKSN